MREIKFRAWDKKNKEMIYLEDSLRLYYGSDVGHFLSIGQAEHSDYYDGSIENFIPMLYTGLKDKNDKEIYEGDVVQFAVDVLDDGTFGNNLKAEYFVLAKVIYKASAYRYDWGPDAPIAHSACEIIGNIYENPEL